MFVFLEFILTPERGRRHGILNIGILGRKNLALKARVAECLVPAAYCFRGRVQA